LNQDEFRNYRHVFVNGFINNGVNLGFPIFNTIGFPKKAFGFCKYLGTKCASDNQPSFIPFFFQIGLLARKSFCHPFGAAFLVECNSRLHFVPPKYEKAYFL
jgi:hypothetical protein